MDRRRGLQKLLSSLLLLPPGTEKGHSPSPLLPYFVIHEKKKLSPLLLSM
jgi:hypothetical protein